ncbi:MAG: 3-phosphoshikimate 1-carboxyvinyltransferase, partial [Oscillospiraceae bacterium]|nr:3-phosphoshikimate 1-carboxyvinyltransferase [Oscillospiraceae bacterium]
FLVAGALGAEVECIGLNPDSLQGDRRIVEILKDCGAEVALTPSSGLAAKAPANGGGLRARSIDVSDVPDLVPPLAALLCFCEGESRIYNAARLRDKESDRLAAVTSELGALGANIAETPDGLVIRGAQRLRGGNARAWGDHRIAMMAACAALRCETPVTIDDPDCVSKSYPAFWRDFERAERGSIQ